MADRSDQGPVAVHRARTGFEARVVVAVLADAGIQAFTPDGLLADEFAVSQRLMNLQGVDVLVRAEDADAASQALAEARAAGRDWTDEEGGRAGGATAFTVPSEREQRARRTGAFLLLLLVLGVIPLLAQVLRWLLGS
ncbi:MAG: hypothetical protein ACO4CZ_12030 [Planctomycetota bacterium]